MRQDIVNDIRAAGWDVEFKPFCEDAETPGFLGMIAGVCVMSRKVVKIATEGRTEEQIEAALRHELHHVLGEEHVHEEDGSGIVCGGHRNAFGVEVTR